MSSSSEPAKAGSLAVDLVSLAVCSLIWGTTWRVIKLQLGAVPPLESVVYRFALASGLLFAWLLATRRPIALTRRQHLAVLAQGAFGFCIQYGCVYVAEETVPSGAMAVMFAATAFINLVAFRLLLKHRASPLAWAGVLLGLAGVAAMSVSQVLEVQGHGDTRIGVLIALAGALTAVISNLFAARAHAAGVAVVPATAWAMGYGAVLLGGFVLLTGQPWRFEVSTRYIGSLLYLSVFGSVTAFVVFYFLARRRSYTFAAYIAALTPPTAMILSGLTEQARWGWAALAGVALVLAGQVLLIRGARS